MEGRDPTEFTLKEKVGFIAQGVLSGKIFDLAKPANRSLWKELSGYFAQPEVKAKLNDEISAVPEPERRAFLLANLVTEQLTFRLFKKFVRQFRNIFVLLRLDFMGVQLRQVGVSSVLVLWHWPSS